MIRRRSREGQMRRGSGPRTARALPPTPEDTAERRRISFYDLFFLAAGGVIGSGWLSGAADAYQSARSSAVFSWLIGGALMLVIAVVMVKLSTAVPKTGGLIFLPLQSSLRVRCPDRRRAAWISRPPKRLPAGRSRIVIARQVNGDVY